MVCRHFSVWKVRDPMGHLLAEMLASSGGREGGVPLGIVCLGAGHAAAYSAPAVTFGDASHRAQKHTATT